MPGMTQARLDYLKSQNLVPQANIAKGTLPQGETLASRSRATQVLDTPGMTQGRLDYLKAQGLIDPTVTLADVQRGTLPGEVQNALQTSGTLPTPQAQVTGQQKQASLPSPAGTGVKGKGLPGVMAVADAAAQGHGQPGSLERFRTNARVGALRNVLEGQGSQGGQKPQDSPSTMEENTRSNVIAGDMSRGYTGDARETIDYRRPSGYRRGVRDAVWENAIEVDGQVKDPLTGKAMNKDDPWHMGHKPGYEFRKHQQSAKNRGISREEFLDEHNNPEHYRSELPSSNQSHKGEDMTDQYFGP